MTAPNLDFSIDRSSYQRWKKRWLAILVLGLSLQISHLAWQWQTLEGMRNNLESIRHRAMAKTVDLESTALTPQQRKSAQALQEMLSHLSVPWEALLAAIEASRNKAIVLESIQLHPEDRSLNINLNAPGFNELSEFVELLAKQDLFMSVTILSESIVDSGKNPLRAAVRVNLYSAFRSL